MTNDTPDLVIKNGTLVTASDVVRADVAVTGGKVSAIGRDLDGRQTLDAAGMLVMPGGVDPHVHLQYPQGPHKVVSSDDWLTGTVAAAYGGTTTVIDFIEARPDQTFMQAFEERLDEARGSAVIDFGLHMAFNRVDQPSLAEVPEVIEAGVPSFKIYMAYDGIRLTDSEMLTALHTLRKYGGQTLVHAENHDLIMDLVRQRLDEGRVEPRWHPTTRPAAGEIEATRRALALAEVVGVPMHIVHVSTGSGAQIIRQCRQRGLPVTGEACTQHLLLTADLYDQPGFEPAKYVMAPPLRPAPDLDSLWLSLRSGDLSLVATDHCPFTLAQKRGQRRTPEFRNLPEGSVNNPDETSWADNTPAFNQIPGGAPGIETRLPLMFHFGVNQGRLSLTRFVEVTSTAAAKLFGLYPQKGTLMPGADADLVVFDPNREVTISSLDLHQNCDYTPYEGMTVKGWPNVVISRGEIIVRDGQYRGRMERGQFVARRRPGEDPVE